MLQLGGDPDLAEEALGADGGRQLRLENLDSHLPLMLGVPGEIDESHPALSQQALHLVMAGECFPQSFQLIGQGNSGQRGVRTGSTGEY